MERLSIFDIYKIGVGPSSSHTLGPWKAAIDFIGHLKAITFDRIEIHLYGSLSKTGKGHATDIAVQMGLEGHDPETIDTEKIEYYLTQIQSKTRLVVHHRPIYFHPTEHIRFHSTTIKAHPNTVIFKAFNGEKRVVEHTYYSVGGGFIEKKGAINQDQETVSLPYPIDTGSDVLRYTTETQKSFHEIIFFNECSFREPATIRSNIATIYTTMLNCVFKGCRTSGILPGGLQVKRRAKPLCDTLLKATDFNNVLDWLAAIKQLPNDFTIINKFISCFALAVNEENAALGRVVTSPTNGAAGVIPAVLLYYLAFCENKGMEDVEKFLLVSGEIGCLFKKGATISAAVGGCQAEIGVSSAMAAAGLTEVQGGTPQQVLMAAEIAMEHHLGLTCDPIGGLVQIPCIERNTMGAMKAITASNLALSSNPDDAIVQFDIIVKTMWDTAQEMNKKYKETSEGGLAFNLPVILPEC